MAVNFEALAQLLLHRAEELVPQWLSGGRREGHEWLAQRTAAGGPGDSLRCNLRTGRWAHFSNGHKGGDLTSLYAYLHSLPQLDAARELAPLVGYELRGAGDAATAALIDLPSPLPPPDAPLPDFGDATAHWCYRNTQGTLYYTARYDSPEGKLFSWFTWDINRWRRKAPTKPRPLYGLDRLESASDNANILIVEGEKCADAALGVLPQYVVMTWAGGANAIKYSDWTPIQGRRVYLWPDADDTGRKAMASVSEILNSQGCTVLVIDPRDAPSEGWDVADAVADGWNTERLGEWVGPRLLPSSKALVPIKQSELVEHTPAAETGKPSSILVLWENLHLDFDSKRIPYPTLANIGSILQAHQKYQGKIWFDLFRGRIMQTNKDGLVAPWTDHEEREITAFIQRDMNLPKVGVLGVREAVRLIAFRNRRNSVLEWLNGLVWDGTERLNHWLTDFLGVERTPYSEAIGRNWLISLVARALRPGCQADHMPVLEGASGRGKSSALAIMGGEWYQAISQEFGGQKFIEAIQGQWLVEIPDMAGFGRREHSQIISAITTRSDRYRDAYGHNAEDHARVTIFAATSETDDYLKDRRGIRRYWPLRCSEINLDALEAAREQLFAEAVAEKKAGATWHEMPAATRQEQLARQESHIWLEDIADYCLNLDKVTVAQVAKKCLIPREIVKGGYDHSTEIQIAKCLGLLGWTMKPEWLDKTTQRVYRPSSSETL